MIHGFSLNYPFFFTLYARIIPAPYLKVRMLVLIFSFRAPGSFVVIQSPLRGKKVHIR